MTHDFYLYRCLELAKLGADYAAPNPMVGAVLVFNGRIIGEGYHEHYGEAHAEVNCINLVKNEDRKFISQSTLYVSLEPCTHFGKTPPCTDLIIKNKIPKVVIGSRDPFQFVNGKGIEKLKAAGAEVILAETVMEKECKEINKRYFTYHTQHRPYIILKWAETADRKIAGDTSKRTFITNEMINRLVHKWRSEEASILVGTNTALKDNPELTNRLWPGPSPVRIVLDMNLRLPLNLHLFNGKQKTIIFNRFRHEESGTICYYRLANDVSLAHQIIKALYNLKLQSVLVEGGAVLLQLFIDLGIWDETRIIKNEKMIVGNGVAAPVIQQILPKTEMKVMDNLVSIYYHENV